MANRNLKIFLTVCKHNSISKAAKELNLAQPAVSFAIKELEKDYDCLLFYRYPKRIEITNKGSQLLVEVNKLTSLYNEVQIALHTRPDETSFSIGASITLSKHFLPLYLGEFSKLYPRVKLSSLTDTNDNIIKSTIDKKISIGFIDSNYNNSELNVIPYYRDELVLVCYKDHELASAKSLNIHQIKDCDLLVRTSGNGDRDAINNLFKKFKYPLCPILENDLGIVLLNAVANNIGVAILPSKIVYDYAQHLNIKIIPLEEAELVRFFSVIYRKDHVLSDKEKHLIDISVNQENNIINK